MTYFYLLKYFHSINDIFLFVKIFSFDNFTDNDIFSFAKNIFVR